jgi:hypothetical protein
MIDRYSDKSITLQFPPHVQTNAFLDALKKVLNLGSQKRLSFFDHECDIFRTVAVSLLFRILLRSIPIVNPPTTLKESIIALNNYPPSFDDLISHCILKVIANNFSRIKKHQLLTFSVPLLNRILSSPNTPIFSTDSFLI